MRPDDQEILTDLQALGMSALASRVYLELLRTGQWVSGYEVAKALGVARANVYDALRLLVKEGFARRMAFGTAEKYSAVPFSVAAGQLYQEMESRLKRLQERLPPGRRPSMWQGTSWKVFRQEADTVLRQARNHVAIGTSPAPVRYISDVLASAPDPSLEAAYHCWAGCPESGCGVCQPPVTHLVPWANEPSCLIVVDDRLAVGTWGREEEATVLVTDYPAVVAGWRALLHEREA